jgi:hypothetical protein
MPLKLCEWCRKPLIRKRGEKSKLFIVRRFCDVKCMAKAREMEKKIAKNVKRKLD